MHRRGVAFLVPLFGEVHLWILRSIYSFNSSFKICCFSISLRSLGFAHHI